MKEGGGRKQGAASPCAACKLLRRRCAQDCVFAPYFPADEPQKFANVHKVFGASNVNKMLQVLSFFRQLLLSIFIIINGFSFDFAPHSFRMHPHTLYFRK